MYTTIAAISTPPGKGGIAVLRVSGPDAAAIADRVFIPRGTPLSLRPARTAVFGQIRDGDTVLDTGIATLFSAPASFTGEDTVEISCHGGVAVTRAVLAALFRAGAEPAGPGDFTKRAFMNGKLTLTEAEAVGLLIDADTESRRKLAAGALSGTVAKETAEIADSLTAVLSALYAAIDYPEEDVGDEGERQIAAVIENARRRVQALCATYKTGAAIAYGIPTVIVGEPNSGKSSLYNALLGREDAIVTDIPGTTRDVLTANADVGGVTLTLSDTAGIRTDTADAVEQIGVDRARQKMGEAALILFAADRARPLTEEARGILASLPAEIPVIAVLGKSDLPDALTEDDRALIAAAALETVTLSARTGEGMDALRAAVARTVGADAVDPARDAVIWDVRQRAALARAADALAEAEAALAAGDPPDAVCTLCESAVADIAGVDGRAVDEAIIEGIFARFCVGK